MNKSRLLGSVCAFTLAVLSTFANASTIWVGDALGGQIETFDDTGAPLGFAASVPFPISGMTTVGNEIWVGDASGQIERLDASGAHLGPVSFAPFHIGGMTTVGNVIWVGGANVEIETFDASGAYLGPLSGGLPFQIGGMTTVGNEIWIGDAMAGRIDKLDTFGRHLGPVTFTPFSVSGMTTVGNVIWVGGPSGEIERYDASGAYLGPLSGGAPFQIGGMTTVVPLPAALWLFGTGLLGLIGMSTRKKPAQ